MRWRGIFPGSRNWMIIGIPRRSFLKFESKSTLRLWISKFVILEKTKCNGAHCSPSKHFSLKFLLIRLDRSKAVDILVKDLKVFASLDDELFREMTMLLTLDNFRCTFYTERLSSHLIKNNDYIQTALWSNVVYAGKMINSLIIEIQKQQERLC